MATVTAQDLRDLVAELIAPTIGVHRASAALHFDNSEYWPPQGAPDEEEVDRFVAGNPLLDEETREQLLDPGLLGFSAKRAEASDEWLAEFRQHIVEWAATEQWQGADDPWLASMAGQQPVETELWVPGRDEVRPPWINRSRSALLIAQELVARGRLLSELSWQEFEDLIARLLERDGWTVGGLKRTKDGGVDVWASIVLGELGEVQSIWQAKKYGPNRKVQLHQVRELSGNLDRTRATKAVVVTTSALTRGALAWVREDRFRLGYHDAASLMDWIRSTPKRLR